MVVLVLVWDPGGADGVGYGRWWRWVALVVLVALLVLVMLVVLVVWWRCWRWCGHMGINLIVGSGALCCSSKQCASNAGNGGVFY